MSIFLESAPRKPPPFRLDALVFLRNSVNIALDALYSSACGWFVSDAVDDGVSFWLSLRWMLMATAPF